jgi:hypothetical protein
MRQGKKMNEVKIYKEGKEWRVALNPKTECKIYCVASRHRADELANELLLRTGEK